MDIAKNDPEINWKIADVVFKCLETQNLRIKRIGHDNPLLRVECLRNPHYSFTLEFHEGILEIKVEDYKISDTLLDTYRYSYSDDHQKIANDICKSLDKICNKYNELILSKKEENDKT
jgi:hypothetical protein